jgi:5-methyltetrahydropteroyltriglutamate--homocysteine methyltransferase
MTIPTEPIGSMPRPQYLLTAMNQYAAGALDQVALKASQDQAVAETIERFEAVGSPVVTDGEQAKPSFATYSLSDRLALAPDGVVIPFADGHTRRLPRLTAGPFRYGTFAVSYLDKARKLTDRPVKQAVIAPSALSLLYPQDGIAGYSQEQFLADLADQSEIDIRQCLDAGADSVQLDFTEGRLSIKLDPTKGILRSFVELNNSVLDRFSAADRARIGVHTCPGGDQDSVHSLDVDYAELLPDLFNLHAGRFYVQLASEADKARVLSIIRDNSHDDQRIFIGVTDPINPRVETREEVRDRVIEAAEYLPPDRLGTCDDCGFSPFADDVSTSRDTAFAKVAARVAGTRLAEQELGG